MSQRICEVDGCEREHDAKGMCKNHYMRFSRTGATDLPLPRAPRLCEIEGCDLKHYAKGRCSKHHARSSRQRKPWTSGFCAECGESFITNQPQTRFCSSSCKRRNKDRVHEHRRSERIKASGPRDRIDLPALAKRDGWRCHICDRKVTRTTWSVDHLIPLSHGGSHTYENVALAHHRCNSTRRDTGMAQLRLSA